MSVHLRIGPDETVVHYSRRRAETGQPPWRVVVSGSDSHYFTKLLADWEVANWVRLVPLSRTEVAP